MSTRVEVSRDLADISLLEPLWLHLREYQGGLEGVPPLQDAATSWAIEQATYRQMLRHPDAFIVLATRGLADVVGYAFVKVHRGADEMWRTGDRIANLETLSVAPSHRGVGIGGLIMDGVLSELLARGIADFQVSVLSANESAVRFYSGYGLKPRLTTLSNFGQTHQQ